MPNYNHSVTTSLAFGGGEPSASKVMNPLTSLVVTDVAECIRVNSLSSNLTMTDSMSKLAGVKRTQVESVEILNYAIAITRRGGEIIAAIGTD